MQQTYSISGMTCNGCKNDVEETLSQVEGVSSANVNLERGEAVVKMVKPIAVTKFQNTLPSKYSISEKKEFKQPLTSEKSKLQQLKPLFFILFYITSASILLNYKSWNWSSFMYDFMGLFFIVFSFFKILDLKGFAESFKMYDPLAKKIPTYGLVYPFIETVLGLLFLMRINVTIALLLTLVVLGITTFGVTKTLVDKKSIRCACLGTTLNLPMTEATFIENAIMIIMAISMLINIF